MDHDVGIRQRKALAFRSSAQQHRAHARCHAEAVGRHIAGEKLHRIIDCQPGRDRAAWRVDIKIKVLLSVLHLQEEHLRDDQIRDVIVDRCADENNPVLEQPRIDIVGALSPAGLLDHHRDQHTLGNILT